MRSQVQQYHLLLATTRHEQPPAIQTGPLGIGDIPRADMARSLRMREGVLGKAMSGFY